MKTLDRHESDRAYQEAPILDLGKVSVGIFLQAWREKQYSGIFSSTEIPSPIATLLIKDLSSETYRRELLSNGIVFESAIHRYSVQGNSNNKIAWIFSVPSVYPIISEE